MCKTPQHVPYSFLLHIGNMNTLSSDTCPEIARLHVELLRKAPLFQKLQMATSLVGPLSIYTGREICERDSNETLERRRERFLFLLHNDGIMEKRVATLLIQKEKARYTMKTPDILEISLIFVNTRKDRNSFQNSSFGTLVCHQAGSCFRSPVCRQAGLLLINSSMSFLYN